MRYVVIYEQGLNEGRAADVVCIRARSGWWANPVISLIPFTHPALLAFSVVHPPAERQ